MASSELARRLRPLSIDVYNKRGLLPNHVVHRATSSSSRPPPGQHENQHAGTEKSQHAGILDSPSRKARKLRARAALLIDEFRDDLRDRVAHVQQKGAGMKAALRGGISLDKASRALNSRLHHYDSRWREANNAFDDWFNARFWLAYERFQQHRKQMSASSPKKVSPNCPPMDLIAMLYLGAAGGGMLHQQFGLGILFAACGFIRTLRRFVVHHVDTGNVDGMFRWAPAAIHQKRFEIFSRLKQEVFAARKIMSYDSKWIDLSWMDHRSDGKGPDLHNDYTPETLFDDTMLSVSAHPRVSSFLGSNTRPLAEPDKVLYRINGDVSEIYLSWKVVGSKGTAQIQVKSVARVLDFIYVFPDGDGKYGLRPDGFVIRPNGGWSLNCSDLPRDMKNPFKRGERDGFSPEAGMFDSDWFVREFRQGGPPKTHY